MTPVRPPSVALFAPSDRGRVAPVLAALRAAGVHVADSPATDPSARVVFFASGRSTSSTPLLIAALNAKDAGTLVGVVLDDSAADVLSSWALPDLIDARSATPDAVAAALRRVLPASTPPDAVTPPVARPRLFISYASEDQEFVNGVMSWLVTQGWEPWVYSHAERPFDQTLHEELGKAVAGSRAVAFVLSPDWVKSKYCKRELALATAQEKPAVYLEVRRFDTNVVKQHAYTADQLRLDFTDAADESASFRLLADRLRQIKAAKK